MVKSAAEQHYGSWLSYPAQMRLPDVRSDFDHNRDPHVAEQIKDMDKTESERRSLLTQGEQSGGSGGRGVAPASGLQAQRDAAFRQYQTYKQNTPPLEQNNVPHLRPYYAPRYSGPSM